MSSLPANIAGFTGISASAQPVSGPADLTAVAIAFAQIAATFAQMMAAAGSSAPVQRMPYGPPPVLLPSKEFARRKGESVEKVNADCRRGRYKYARAERDANGNVNRKLGYRIPEFYLYRDELPDYQRRYFEDLPGDESPAFGAPAEEVPAVAPALSSEASRPASGPDSSRDRASTDGEDAGAPGAKPHATPSTVVAAGTDAEFDTADLLDYERLLDRAPERKENQTQRAFAPRSRTSRKAGARS